MEDRKEEEILNKLEKFKEKKIVICQTGFIQNKFTINCLKYKIEYDTLIIYEKDEEKYICINLNQIYKYELKDNYLKMYLDNDTIIELLIN